jgi:manganese/zinc/iron transport system permease protein
VLSIFFGLGILLLTLIQQIPEGHAAGSEGFIYGKTASMIAEDAMLIASVTGCVLLVALLLYRPLQLLCFDEGYAASQGWPVLWLDGLLMALVVAITIVGLQAVGLIMMIALLVIPAAASRFWTHQLPKMLPLSAVLATLSCLVGATISAITPRVPSGAAIVLIAVGTFLVSMFFGKARGIYWNWLRNWKLKSSYDREHLLRDLYELVEVDRDQKKLGKQALTDILISVDVIEKRRLWSHGRMLRLLYRLQLQGLVLMQGKDLVRFTASGCKEAERLTYDHRLWELYLMTYADVDPLRVDRSADDTEHALDPEIIGSLKAMIDKEWNGEFPPSPHPLESTEQGGVKR